MGFKTFDFDFVLVELFCGVEVYFDVDMNLEDWKEVSDLGGFKVASAESC